jgi:hypothetical protein
MSAEFETQKALFSALTGLGLTVYDVAPQVIDGASSVNWPYVTIGAAVFSQWDTKQVVGFNFVVRIHVRSRSAAMGEVKGIQGQIFDRLHHGGLAITGYTLTLLQFETSDITELSDRSFDGISEFRGMIEKA